MNYWEKAFTQKSTSEYIVAENVEMILNNAEKNQNAGHQKIILGIHQTNNIQQNDTDKQQHSENTAEPGNGNSSEGRKPVEKIQASDIKKNTAFKKHSGWLFAGKKKISDKPPRTHASVLKKIHRSLDDIWSNIYLETNKRQNVLMLCGATAGEGATFISFHLAMFLAVEHNMKVLYVDTDMGFGKANGIIPSVSKYSGLASYLLDNQPLMELVLKTEHENFFVLPSGFSKLEHRIKNKNIIFKKEAVENLIEYCKNTFDITIFDGQPIAFNPVMIGFARAVGKVVMVCRYSYSRREVTRLALEKLRKSNVSVIGAILNDRQYPIPPKIYNILK